MTSARAREQLRQEREAFNQEKAQAANWFRLRLAMGYAGLGLLFLIATISGYVVLTPTGYSSATIAIAATTLMVDMLGLVVSIFKLVLAHGSAVTVRPITGAKS